MSWGMSKQVHNLPASLALPLPRSQRGWTCLWSKSEGEKNQPPVLWHPDFCWVPCSSVQLLAPPAFVPCPLNHKLKRPQGAMQRGRGSRSKPPES